MTSFTDCTFPGNPGIRGVGHGLFLYEADGRTSWGHSGLMIGYESIVLHRPQTGTTVAVVGNVSRFNALGVALDLDRALDAPEGDGALQAPAPLP
jgi:hypothetical protein